MSWFQWQNGDLILDCRLQPNASSNEIIGIQSGSINDSLKIRITAPPIDGKANRHLIQFLAKLFGVSKSSILIEKGELGRQKRIRIQAPRKIPAKLSMINL